MTSMAGDQTPSAYHGLGSPIHGGCVGTFLRFFDWNAAKRFSSIKRLPANKLEKALQRSSSDRNPESKTRMICDVEGGEEGVASSEVDHGAEIGDGEDASGRAPALPETTRAYQPHRRCQSCSGGASLASLMYDEDVGSRDALRRRREEAVSAYIDIPSVIVHRRARGPSSKPPCLSRRTSSLRPSKLHTPRENPSMMSPGERNHLQRALGWPFVGQRIPNLDDESSHELSSRSESDSSERANASSANESSARECKTSEIIRSPVKISPKLKNLRTSSASLEPTSTISLPISSKPAATKAARPSPKFTITAEANVKADAMARKSMRKAPHGHHALKARCSKVGPQRGKTFGMCLFPSARSPPASADSLESGSFLGYGGSLGAGDNRLPVVRSKRFGEQEMKPSPTLGRPLAGKTLQEIKLSPTLGHPSAGKILQEIKLSPTLGHPSAGKTLQEIWRMKEKVLASTIAPVQASMDDRLKLESDMVTQNSKTQPVSGSLSRPSMFGQGFVHVDDFSDDERGGVSRRFDWPSSPLIGCGEASPAVDDLNWVDEAVEQWASSPPCGSYCERSCSGPSNLDSSDVDDDRNGDAWSSCTSYNPAYCESPNTFELPDTGPDSDLPLQKSPVSIVNWPFYDEACTTSDSSLPDSYNNADEDGFRSYSDNNEIRQALMDISVFKSLEAFTFEYKERVCGAKEEQSFVREVLSAAHFLSAPGSSPDWFNRDVAIDPSLFDRLELGGYQGLAVDKWFQVSGGLWRCDRKLLFDCVNEAFGLVLWRCRGSEMGPPVQRPWGQKLVEEVHKKIEEWRRLAAYDIDFLVERDMCMSSFGSWKDFNVEVPEVGLDIESMLWKAIVEEAVVDILSTSKCRHYCSVTEQFNPMQQFGEGLDQTA